MRICLHAHCTRTSLMDYCETPAQLGEVQTMKRSIRESIKRLATFGTTAAMLMGTSHAGMGDECCVVRPAYKLVTQTQWVERQVTAYKIEHETVYDETPVTVYKQVVETELRERRYTVAHPVCETAEVEQRRTVMKPVTELETRDMSYNQVRDVCETGEREERHIVQHPVIETSEREEHQMVRRAITETAERDQYSTVCEPVTTYRTEYVDRGGYVDVQSCKPGESHTHLGWIPGGCAVDPVTGTAVQQHGGFGWITQQGPPRTEVARVYQPNVVAQNVPQTNYVQRVVATKVPVQVTRYVDEDVVYKVPVQTTRYVPEEVVNKIPVTTHRQVVERVPNMVQVQVTRYVPQEEVRKVPVTTTRMQTEEKVEQINVQVPKMVATQQVMRTPRMVEKRVPVTCTVREPHTVTLRVPYDQPSAVVPTSYEVPVVPQTSCEVPTGGPILQTPATPATSSADAAAVAPTLNGAARSNSTYYAPSNAQSVMKSGESAVEKTEPTPAVQPTGKDAGKTNDADKQPAIDPKTPVKTETKKPAAEDPTVWKPVYIDSVKKPETKTDAAKADAQKNDVEADQK